MLVPNHHGTVRYRGGPRSVNINNTKIIMNVEDCFRNLELHVEFLRVVAEGLVSCSSGSGSRGQSKKMLPSHFYHQFGFSSVLLVKFEICKKESCRAGLSPGVVVNTVFLVVF